MPDTPRLSIDTVSRLAVESVPIKINHVDKLIVVALVSQLSSDMTSMRSLPVGEADPAPIYHADHK